ncbi:SusC/RagA family TonB-linked outer membrane protein [Siphonobacter sp. SORGH_AS_0500]|uniref:SusC/RagA family TonB-linked outer membrane protein n=1 Tax=Siphonobacter sp. SORGH_AS_0500 TaxID=1864824 RepID=UPI0028556C5B|nr:SusC/RagA family TonB-linked outer membrane protein [Siphonobacter sp. SORGH_AS_0500]MDR6197919.1 TonB-linked SusC/RagA family outer membrane protein [Siphonobacter sp. SORGH_AS_0500]
MKNHLYVNKRTAWLFALVLGSTCLNANSQQLDSLKATPLFAPGMSQSNPFLTSSTGPLVSSSISGTTIAKTPVPNVTNALYGRLQGLIVRQNSGEPGYDAATLNIRGLGTYDNSDLVICVDGFITTSSYFQYLSPSEIESITVLKDPASLAAFGMKGANGVLWIVTKRGTISKPQIQFNLVTGLQQALRINKPYGSYDYARLYNQAISNDNYALNNNTFVWSPKYTDAQLQAYQNGTAPSVDWYAETLKKYGRYQNANLSFTGGDQVSKYAVILDYMKQTGLYNVPTSATTSNAQIQRFNLRTNLDFKFFKIFEARVDLGGRIEDRQYPNYNGPKLWRNLASYPSNIYQVRDGNTQNWSGTSLYPDNPVASLLALGRIATHDRTLQANFNLKENLDFITPGLSIGQAISFNTWTRNTLGRTASYARFNNGVNTTTDKATDIASIGSSPTNQYNWQQITLNAAYKRSVGKHALSADLNYFLSDYMLDWNINASGLNTGNNIFYHYQNLGGQFQYSYDDKYLLALSAGYSGSDNYAPGNRWAFYPALSLGWVVSKEDFLAQNKAITFLKVRASAGQSGFDQSNQGRYLYQQYFTGSGTYYTGNNGLNGNSGIAPSYAANPEIRAERNTGYNVGVDLQLWNKLSLTADGFFNKRTGIVTVDYTLPGVFGANPPYRNLGIVSNKGFELALNFTDKVGDVKYHLNAMTLYAHNQVKQMGEVAPVNAFSRLTGQRIQTTLGLQAVGFYDVTDFNADGTLKSGIAQPTFGSVQPGDIRYKDTDGNGKVDLNDVSPMKYTSLPEWTYAFDAGLSYKSFDFSVLLQGAAHRSVNLLNTDQAVAFVDNTNVYPSAGQAWAYYPDQGIDTRATATYPRFTTKANMNNYLNSTFWMKNGSFLRVRNIEIGYTLPSQLLHKIHLENVRIYVNATNPFTWSYLSKHYNIDPETISGYAGLKTYNTGITLSF